MALIVWVLATWLAIRSVQYVTGSGAMGYHVESAAVFFVVAGLVVRLLRKTLRRVVPLRICSIPSVSTVVLWWLAAIALFWPALWIGFLSDDFDLADLAARGAIGFVTPMLFRPVPLALWGTILRAGGGPVTIHLINVLLHGTNAYLAARIAAAYVRDRFGALLVGILVVCFPLSQEAVAWAAGVFDVMATTWVLCGVLVARDYGEAPCARRRVALWICGAAALLSKETAAVMPLLIGLDMWATGSSS